MTSFLAFLAVLMIGFATGRIVKLLVLAWRHRNGI